MAEAVVEVEVSLLEHCPSCGVRWWDRPLPEDKRNAVDGRTHYSNIIGEIWHDRVQQWRCPNTDCNAVWVRGTKIAKP